MRITIGIKVHFGFVILFAPDNGNIPTFRVTGFEVHATTDAVFAMREIGDQESGTINFVVDGTRFQWA